MLSLASARAEVKTLVTGYQYGLTYLPLMIMQHRSLVEKNATALGLINLKTDWKVLSGPAPINDGLLTRALHVGAVGTPSLVTLWAKTKDRDPVRAVGSLSCMPMYLNTTNPKIKTVKDFDSQDRIAVPSVKVGVQAVTLQMAAAQALGDEKFAALDPLTVAMAHPEAYVALMSGKSITAHFGAAPFQTQELEQGLGKVHTVLKSYDVLGGKSTFTLAVATDSFRKENPLAYKAYVAAFAEATALINADKRTAAEIFLKVSGSKESPESILRILNDSDNEFDLTPRNITKYAAFMHQVGTIKAKPASWRELAHPNLHDRPGT
jgi:NitT/TauT family transport system substrate-binding protein